MSEKYTVEGRRFIWHALDDDDQRTIDVTIPLRIKYGMMKRAGLLKEKIDADTVGAFFEALIPTQQALLDELDLIDLMDMFTTWQAAYEEQNGASLGEAEGSPTSSASTATPSSTTGEPVSA